VAAAMRKYAGSAILKKMSDYVCLMTEVGVDLTLYFNHFPFVLLNLFSGNKFIQINPVQNAEILVWKARRVHTFLGK
jgi:hypothetical protein